MPNDLGVNVFNRLQSVDDNDGLGVFFRLGFKTVAKPLFMAARAQLVEEVIAPALAAGQTVVCDRFLLSSVVYQGYAGGLDPQMIYNVGLAATRGLVPDKTFVLDVPQEVAVSRMTNRELDSIEREDAQFKQRLRDGFKAESKKHPKSIIIIDGLQSIEDVHAEIVRHL